LRHSICKAIGSSPDVAEKSTKIQADNLLPRDLQTYGKDLTPFLIVVDALDECNKERGRDDEHLIPLLARYLCSSPSPVKLLVTSSPKASIRQMFERIGLPVHHQILHNVEAPIVQADIARYLRHGLDKIRHEKLDGEVWPTDSDFQLLAKRAGRLFIYAAIALSYISRGSSPERKLANVLSAEPHSHNLAFAALDSLYMRIIKDTVEEDNEDDARESCDAFRRVVGAILVLQEPLSRAVLGKLLNEATSVITSVVRPLDALLDIGTSIHTPIHIFHSSFVHLLTNPKRCDDLRFLIDAKASHLTIAILCLRLMNALLKKDMCNIGDARLLNSEVPELPTRLRQAMSDELRYACSYWMIHLASALESPTPELVRELCIFCNEHILHWIETLSLFKQVGLAEERLIPTIEWSKVCLKNTNA
jgi:hypothetical protein